jgi:antitoxin PrlF
MESKNILLENAMDKASYVRVSSKGQIVLPKSVRDKFAIEEGDYLFIRTIGDGRILVETREALPLFKMTAGLRKAAEEQGFTREELDELIHAIRAERKSDAA